MTSHPRPGPVSRAAVRGGTLIALSCGALVLALAAPASAHLSVHPSGAPSGDYQKVCIRIPNESPTAGTVAVAVSLPTDTPLASVDVQEHVGWKAAVTRTALPEPVRSGELEITEAVTRITWTAEPGVRLAPGQFEEFDFSVGPLPEGVDTLSFPATQTYDDGEVVVWDEPVVEGAEEPEHPVPVLTVAAAPRASHHAASVAMVAAASATTGEAPTGSTASRAKAVGAGGLAVGLFGVGGAVVTARAARRRRDA